MAKYTQKFMDQSGICFADAARGIIADGSGSLFFCERTESGELNPLCAPFYVPPPFRIISNESLDPFFVVFLECGRIYVYNFVDRVQVLDIEVPPYKGMINQVFVRENGTVLLLGSEKHRMKWEDGHWSIIGETIDQMTVDLDNKLFATCAVLENDMCAAVDSDNKEEYFRILSKYMLFITENLPREAVMNLWFEIVQTQKFGDCREELNHIIDLIRTTSELSSYADEMQTAL